MVAELEVLVDHGWRGLDVYFDLLGTDVAGPFLFSGHLDPATKRVSIVKQFIGAHQVDYKGRLGQDLDGMLFIKGRWSI